MSELRIFPVRKYSFLKDDCQWDHFPIRNDIALTIVGSGLFKVIWKATVLEEFDVKDLSELSIHHKFPSVGFKLILADKTKLITLKKFQLAFNDELEFNRLISLLKEKNLIRDKHIPSYNDTAVNLQLSQQLLPSSQYILPSQKLHQDSLPLSNYSPDSLKTMLDYNIQQNQNEQFYNHHRSNMLLNSFTQPSIPTTNLNIYNPKIPAGHTSRIQASQLGLGDLPFNEDEDDFLNEILPPKQTTTTTVEEKQEDLKSIDEMTDDEIKLILRKKIKDLKFMNFVKRIESLLNELQ